MKKRLDHSLQTKGRIQAKTIEGQRDEKREIKSVEAKAVESNRNQRESRKTMENGKAAPALPKAPVKSRSVSKMEEQDCLRV